MDAMRAWLACTHGVSRWGLLLAVGHAHRPAGWGRSGPGEAAGGEAGGVGPVHGGGPAEALEDADDGGGDVDLAGPGAVPGARRVRVVAVVPAFAEREQRERPQVGGAVIAAGGVGAG